MVSRSILQHAMGRSFIQYFTRQAIGVISEYERRQYDREHELGGVRWRYSPRQ